MYPLVSSNVATSSKPCPITRLRLQLHPRVFGLGSWLLVCQQLVWESPSLVQLAGSASFDQCLPATWLLVGGFLESFGWFFSARVKFRGWFSKNWKNGHPPFSQGLYNVTIGESQWWDEHDNVAFVLFEFHPISESELCRSDLALFLRCLCVMLCHYELKLTVLLFARGRSWMTKDMIIKVVGAPQVLYVGLKPQWTGSIYTYIYIFKSN